MHINLVLAPNEFLLFSFSHLYFKIIKQILILDKDDQRKYTMQFLKHDFIC